jgi:hypothetical protein
LALLSATDGAGALLAWILPASPPPPAYPALIDDLVNPLVTEAEGAGNIAH